MHFPLRSPPCAAARGFTVAELLAAVAIVATLAAAAAPSLVQIARDQRALRAAWEVSGLFRLARTRALGRGHAVLVRWDAASARFEVREPQSFDGVAPPGPCGAAADVSARAVADLSVGQGAYEIASADFLDDGGAPRSAAEVCYAPGGRAFIRYGATDAFTPQSGVPRVLMTNTHTGRARAVLLPPSGAARVRL